jgi:O-antigen/teichoic acid export membrane protein
VLGRYRARTIVLNRQSPTTKGSFGTSGGKETLIAFATQVWILLASLATQSVLAWMLAPAGRGAYAVCVLFVGIMAAVFSLGMDRAAQYFVMSNTQSMSHGGSVAIITALVGGGVAVVLGAFLIYSPIEFFQKADSTAFWISLPLIPLTVVVAVLQLQLAGQRRFARIGLFMIVQTSTNLALILLLVRFLDLGVDGALIAQIASSVLVIALLSLDLRVACGFRLMLPNWSHFQQVFSYGIRYYLASMGNMIDLGLGTFIIAMLGSREDIGIFAAASALVLKVLVLPDSIEAVMLPRITADPVGRIDLVGQCVRLSILFTGLALAGLVVVSVPLVNILLSPKFLASVPLIWILAPGVFMYGGSQMLMGYFRAINRPGICSLVMWVGFVVNGLTLIALYPLLKLQAVAWAMTIGFASRSLVLFLAYQRISGRDALDMMRFQRGDFELIKRLLRRT